MKKSQIEKAKVKSRTLLFEKVGFSLALESVLISLSNEKDDAGRKPLTSSWREYITQLTCIERQLEGVACVE